MGLNILNAYTGKSGQTLFTGSNNKELFDALSGILDLDERFQSGKISENYYRAERVRLKKIAMKYITEDEIDKELYNC